MTLVAVPLPRDCLRVSGPDAETFLQGQLSQDVAAIPPGDSAWSLILQPQGKVEGLVRVTRLGPEEFFLDTEAGFGEGVTTRLRRFLLRTKADIEPVDLECVSIRDDSSVAAPDDTGGATHVERPADGHALAARWPVHDGVDLVGPHVAHPDGIPLVDPVRFEALRIEAGVPAPGSELTDATIPAEAGRWLIERCVSFTKGCFVGQELVARIDSRGGKVPRQLRLLRAEDVITPGADVELEGDAVGAVTSAAPAPGGGGWVALAYLKRAVDVPARAMVGGTEVTAEPLPGPAPGHGTGGG